jgi:hypothetical protein
MDNLLDCLTIIQTELSRLLHIVHEPGIIDSDSTRECLNDKLKLFCTSLHNTQESIKILQEG